MATNSVEIWSMKDVISSLVLLIVIKILSYELLDRVSSLNAFFISSISFLMSICIVTYFLNEKYPVGLLHRISVGNLMIKTMPLMILCLIVSGMPYSIWLSNKYYQPEEYLLFLDFSSIERIFFFLIIFLLGPFFEEIYYRGFIYRILKRRYNIYVGSFFSVGIYYLFHVIDGDFSISLVALGLIVVYAYEKTNTIWSSILIHSFNNIMWFILTHIGMSA